MQRGERTNSEIPKDVPQTQVASRNIAEWVNMYGDYLYRYALLRTGSRETAEDLVQETFLSAHTSLAGFEGRSSPKTWLISILKNKIVDHIRKTSRAEIVQLNTQEPDAVVNSNFTRFGGIWKRIIPAWNENPEELVRQKDFIAQLQSCLHQLPRTLKEVLMLRVFEGLSTEEICKHLDISANNLWVILYRSRMRVRQCLETNWFNLKD